MFAPLPDRRETFSEPSTPNHTLSANSLDRPDKLQPIAFERERTPDTSPERSNNSCWLLLYLSVASRWLPQPSMPGHNLAPPSGSSELRVPKQRNPARAGRELSSSRTALH